MTQLSATEAARSFSDVLNRVAAGEQIEVVRSGAPVAVIGPVKDQVLSAERFRELIAAAPPVDEEFADDLQTIRSTVAPPSDPWQS